MFEWRDEFSANIPVIDKQHQRLFELGARLYDLISLRDDFDHYDEIVEIIRELKDYTIYHFGFEEELMERYGYEDLEAHKEEHQMFIDKINEIDYEAIDADQTGAIMDMLMFVANWIENHILKMDLKYKELFQEKGV